MATDQDTPTLKIGELAGRLGLNVRTLHYYEQIGLLPPPHRTESGYRLYSEADERLLRFVMQAKRIGLTLEEVREIVQRSRQGGACDYVRETVQRHIALLDARIAELQRLRADLCSVAAAAEKPDDRAVGAFCRLIEGWAGLSTTIDEESMMANGKRQVEVFTAGCPLCDEAVKLVQSLACPKCEVTVYDLREGCATNECREKAREYGVHRVPAVVIDGKLADCCQVGPVTAEGLRAAGLGAA
jgi:DNA-binding transcriptional MerR regulator